MTLFKLGTSFTLASLTIDNLSFSNGCQIEDSTIFMILGTISSSPFLINDITIQRCTLGISSYTGVFFDLQGTYTDLQVKNLNINTENEMDDDGNLVTLGVTTGDYMKFIKISNTVLTTLTFSIWTIIGAAFSNNFNLVSLENSASITDVVIN